MGQQLSSEYGAGGADHAPLILTAALDRAAFARLDTLRRTHFPPERNQVPAHVTLFHQLPPSALGDVLLRLKLIARGHRAIPGKVAAPFSLGNGVALRIDAPDLDRLRDELADAWVPLLTAQDRGRPQLHVTIMNKAEPSAARALLDRMRAGFVPWPLSFTGVDVWRYRGGPWEVAGHVRFLASQ